jgi:hypothetical protein
MRRCTMTQKQNQIPEKGPEVKRDVSEERAAATERVPKSNERETAEPRKNARIDESGAPVDE